MTIEFDVDRSDEAAVLGHLRSCDADFVPPLSSRVDLAAYAGRLVTRATRFEAWNGPQLVGLVACYLNDREGGVGFITSVSVLKEAGRQGIATTLMTRCLERARGLGFERLQLEVASTNEAALELYRRCGFDAAPASGGTPMTTMNLILEKVS